jgi:hypothetical protein
VGLEVTDRQLSLNAVIAAIEGERLTDDTGHDGDIGYNAAIADAIAAVTDLPESLSQYCPNCEQAAQALAAADARIAEQGAEIERLEHDVTRQMEIANEHVQEVGRLQSLLELARIAISRPV